MALARRWHDRGRPDYFLNRKGGKNGKRTQAGRIFPLSPIFLFKKPGFVGVVIQMRDTVTGCNQ
jgi:hypothetical protein